VGENGPLITDKTYNNFTEPAIQGQRDLTDFFPLNLAIAEVIRLLPTADRLPLSSPPTGLRRQRRADRPDASGGKEDPHERRT